MASKLSHIARELEATAAHLSKVAQRGRGFRSNALPGWKETKNTVKAELSDAQKLKIQLKKDFPNQEKLFACLPGASEKEYLEILSYNAAQHYYEDYEDEGGPGISAFVKSSEGQQIISQFYNLLVA